MPWVYSNTSGTPTGWAWSGLNTYNQHAAKITLPSNCAVTQLKAFVAGYNTGTVAARLALWSVGSSAQVQSSTFTMADGSGSSGGQYWYTKSVTAKVLSSGNYWVGVYRNPNESHVFGTMAGSGDGYRKTNTSSFPSISSMSGYNTDSNDEPTVGCFYITAPDAVTSASVSRVSDTKQTITWTRHSSSDQPYTNIYIERYDNVTGSYYSKATLSGSATSYSDTTTKKDRRYRYRIRAKNAAGYSSYDYTDYIRTTPDNPSSVVATRAGTTVVITWNDNSTAETNQTIQRKTSTDGVSWSSYSTLSSSIAENAESYTDNSPANYNQYQVRADCTDPTLHSDYVESNIVIVIQPPAAPTGMDPDNKALDADDAQTFTWVHNSLDSTEQSKFSIRYRIQGGSFPGTPQVEEEESAISSYGFAGSTFTNGETYEWQVQTWGEHATASDWSDIATFTTVTTPDATITEPNISTDYGYSLLTMTWDYTQAESETQTQYIATLKDQNDNILETINLPSSIASGSSDSATFAYAIENSTTYKVTLTVKCESELWSNETEVEFDTDFYVPATPTIELTTDETIGAINIEITNPSPSGDEVETSYNTLYRSIDGGDWEIAIDNIPPNTTVTDYIPQVGGNSNYYVEAVSESPSIATSAEADEDMLLTGYFFLNSGTNFEDYIKLYGDVSFNMGIGRETVVRRFEGRNYGVKYQGNQLNNTLTFTCDLLKTQYNTLITIIENIGYSFYRDYEGRWFYCALTNCTIAKKDNYAYQFSCVIEKVEV